MTYPPPPWTLQGYAFQTVNLFDIDYCRSFIPSELQIISVLPGKTLGGVYFSSYQSGSVLEYNELIVVPALVRYQEKIAAWVSHIYVDNEDSVAGGREIWGLPKELANFTWDTDGLSVYQNNCQLCSFYHQKGIFNFSTWWRQPLSGNVFGGLNTDLLLFSSTFKSYISLINGQLKIPSESPLAALNMSQPMAIFNLTELTLIVNSPSVVGHKLVSHNLYSK